MADLHADFQLRFKDYFWAKGLRIWLPIFILIFILSSFVLLVIYMGDGVRAKDFFEAYERLPGVERIRIIASLVLIALVLLATLFNPPLLLWSNWKETRLYNEPLHFEVDSQGILITHPSGSLRRTWEGFVGYDKGWGYLLLFVQKDFCLIIPKRAFSEDDLEELMQLTKDRLKVMRSSS